MLPSPVTLTPFSTKIAENATGAVSQTQVFELEQHFEQRRYISAPERDHLANEQRVQGKMIYMLKSPLLPPPQVAVPVLVRGGKPYMGGSHSASYNVTIGSFNPLYGYGYNSYCNYPSMQSIPSATQMSNNHVVDMNLMENIEGPFQQGHFQATLLGIRAW
uniref:Uncharacterized protein n=1 Tax=Oncorhynchus tshawytscha TaxID=74940 RepID=A0A8C8JH28_ONCTS